ncbi:hypothetical protein L1987_33001 [Smallanthus sonchifolius]|uniref:Uncharacterized protein n=1 Tax=Smallanthus sonchifolius TaxID=185202 RepID=A0ACB9HP54_9ASTR|nr:hypothetical protein L1987_33001 [Smallanthus sonchifolius]
MVEGAQSFKYNYDDFISILRPFLRNYLLGFGGRYYSHNASMKEEHVTDVGWLDSNDEVAKIRERFDLAKKRFLKIPDADGSIERER